MLSNFNVVSIGPATLDFIFDPIVTTLRERGHRVTHYADFSKFARESETPLKTADALVAIGSFDCTRGLMMQAPQLRAIVSPSIGTEGFDEAAATALGIVVANGRMPENVLSMAEPTILLILASQYALHWWEHQLRENSPHPAGTGTYAARQDDRLGWLRTDRARGRESS